MRSLECFKAYDIRGKLGAELNAEIAYDIGAAFAQANKLRTAVIGADCRLSSAELKKAFSNGLQDMGVDVFDLGLCGTEEIYHATTHLGVDGGIEITASHNPIDYNGMKLVGAGSRPLDPETEFAEIRYIAEAANFEKTKKRGSLSPCNIRRAYAEKILSLVDISKIKPLKILVNAGNGTAGPAFDEIENLLAAANVPIEFTKIDHAPNGNFPNGIPNPLLIENRPRTARAVQESGADFGVAWDGDFDRCFFFDKKGTFVDGYYLVGLLAQQALISHPGSTIIHDPRMIWNTQEIVENLTGTAIQVRTGHAYIKAAMRQQDAIYAGEMSAHHYFRDFMFCDSGMIPWLMIAELVSTTGLSLGELVKSRMDKFPSSGEMNFSIAQPEQAIKNVELLLKKKAKTVSYDDGLSLDFGDWRLNLRSSSTEPLVRLNIESKGSKSLLIQKTTLLRTLLANNK